MCVGEMWSNRFPGPVCHARTMPLLWCPIPCGAAYGWDSLKVAWRISRMAGFSPRIRAADGLGQGRVNDLQSDADGTLWAATDGGLSRVKNGRVVTLNSKNGLPCDAAHWMMEDDAHSVWLYMACGLVRIPRTDLDAWAADPKRTIQATVFDESDGVTSHSYAGGYSPRVAKSTDGKLWFLPYDGVSVIDPRHLAFNKLPPPVHIEQIVADRKTYWQNWPATRHPRTRGCPRWCAIWRSTMPRSALSRRRRSSFATSSKAWTAIGRTSAIGGKRSIPICVRAITVSA